MHLKPMNGIILTVLGIIFIVVSFLALGGPGGMDAQHSKANISVGLGVVLLIVGVIVIVVTMPK